MKERGVVSRELGGRLVEVAFPRSDACAKCRLCHDAAEGMAAIEAVNELGARRDDEVEVEIPSPEMVKASLVVFLLPVLFLFVGYLAGAWLARAAGWPERQEALGVIVGLLALGGSFPFAGWYDRQVVQRAALLARVVKVLTPR